MEHGLLRHRDVAGYLASRYQHARGDVRVDLAGLPYDQGAGAEDLALELPVYPEGSLEGQDPLEFRAFAEERPEPLFRNPLQ